MKICLNASVDLPPNHPILSYKYPETDVWTEKEIKQFEEAILRYDKSFTEIAQHIKTKSTKQCVEFYYIWKKYKSDSMTKKWKSLKRKRFIDAMSEQPTLRSHNKKKTTEATKESDDCAFGDNDADNSTSTTTSEKTRKKCKLVKQEAMEDDSNNNNNIKSKQFTCRKCRSVI